MSQVLRNIGLLEITLLQLIFYVGLWLWDQYIASYVCIVFPALFLAILLVSIIVELIEPSRISKNYFLIMGVSVCIPILVGAAFYLLYDGQLEWMEGI